MSNDHSEETASNVTGGLKKRLSKVLSRLFPQNPRGPLFAPTVLTHIAIFVGSVCAAFWIYASLVQWSYRELASAYYKANAFRGLLRQDATISVDAAEGQLPAGRQVVLFRTLQLLGEKTSDDTYASLSEQSDAYYGTYNALVVADEARDLSLLDTNKGTVQVIGQLLRHYSDGLTPLSEKKPDSVIDRAGKSLAYLLASQPDAVNRLNAVWHGLNPDGSRREPNAADIDSVLSSLGPQLSLRKDPAVIFLPLTLSSPNRGWRIRSDLMDSLFPSQQVSDADALRNIYRLLGVDTKFNRMNVASGDAIADLLRKQFDKSEQFVFALTARLHADRDVKNARSMITLIQGPEQLGMFIGFFWMFSLLGCRFLKRAFVKSQYRIVRTRIRETLKENDADEPDASLKKRRDAIASLAGQLTLGEALPMAPALIGKLKTAFGKTWNWMRSRRDGEHWGVSLGKILFRWAVGLAGLSVIAVVQAIYAVIVCCIWNAPRSVMQFGRRATVRLLEICDNELKSKSPSSDVLRHACRYLRERDRGSRWLIRWIARALPAIGFIGTVRGISASLSSADSIVRAQTSVDQAAAINAVAGTLGIAFTTTLIALLFGLITSYFDDLQSTQEGDFVRDVEENLVALLEPSLST